MQRAEKRFGVIHKKLRNSNIPNETLASLEVVKLICEANNSHKRKWRIAYIIGVTTIVLLTLFFSLSTPKCLLEIPFESSKLFRNPENCDMCIHVTQVDRIANVSPVDFYEFYVAKARPVVVTDGTKGWSALNTFSFDFFKNLYESVDDESDEPDHSCQFFPYKTEFKSLTEVFSMSPERAKLEPGTDPWYIGWSNCNDEAGKVLREHYSKPYFLPEISENIALNWMFMGGPGLGAQMHVDNVVHPSWQAQLTGRKTWILAPPPECFYKCESFKVTVEPGEIIVVDTNRWYHQTEILPGSISITIGAEFD